MPKKRLSLALLSITIIFLTISKPATFASPAFSLTLAINKQVYNVGETIYVNGNVTDNGALLSDASVAVEIDDPKGDLFFIRTLSTGSINLTHYPIELLALAPCDAGGNPVGSFQPGQNANFELSIRNKAGSSNHVVVTLTIVYSNKAPSNLTSSVFESTMDPFQIINVTVLGFYIPRDAVTGNTTVYANVFNDLPKNGGWAICPEKPAYFLIGTSGGPLQSPPTDSGQFAFEIALSHILVMLGNYTIYATTHYPIVSFDSTTTRFQIILLGDLDPNGRINMLDVAIVARAFGTKVGDTLYNPKADLDPNDKIDMVDVAIVAMAFGTEALLDP